jgi:hypothetical protein
VLLSTQGDRTPLHAAVAKNKRSVALALLEAKADPNLKDQVGLPAAGAPALSAACMECHNLVRDDATLQLYCMVPVLAVARALPQRVWHSLAAVVSARRAEGAAATAACSCDTLGSATLLSLTTSSRVQQQQLELQASGSGTSSACRISCPAAASAALCAPRMQPPPQHPP